MHPASLEDIACAVRGRLSCRSPESRWTGGVQIDSREVQPGDIFVALPGTQRDGHEFISAAWALGAVLAIVRDDRPSPDFGPKLVVPDTAQALSKLAREHRQQSEALIIGVTGSAGKTTTREMIFAALSGQYHGVRSRRNFNNDLGLPLCLLDLRAEHEFAVLELGAARIGEIARLAELSRPEIGVITSIGSAHLETFGSVEGILSGKGELLHALPACGFAVLPGDCPLSRSLAPRARCRVIHVGESHANHLRATSHVRTTFGLRFRVDGQIYDVPVLGRHNLTNALCAIAIGREIGISPAILADCLAEFRPVSGRCQMRRIGDWTVVDDTYNASPPAFAAALDALVEMPLETPGRRFVVAGDMLELGPTSGDEHCRLGEQIGARNIDRLLVIGKYADAVVAGAISAGLPRHQIAIAGSFETLQLVLECWLEPRDLLLIKGSRGMKMERVIEWLTQFADARSKPPRLKCA